MFTSMVVQNFRSIADSGELPLGPITLLVGRNNSGKSALIRSVYRLQEGDPYQEKDMRIGELTSRMVMKFEEIPSFVREHDVDSRYVGGFLILFQERGTTTPNLTAAHPSGDETRDVVRASAREPTNLIYPIFSGRRQASYVDQIRPDAIVSVWPSDQNLAARASVLVASDIPEGREFRRLCRDILGINLNMLTSDNGQLLGRQVSRNEYISLEQMGAGLSGTLSLIIGLCGAKDKLFLIEEPENDLHPQALKVLLDAIVAASEHNQFIISTHSSVVLARLGGLSGSIVLHATIEDGQPPTSSFAVVRGSEARLDVLRDLGYELADLDLAEGWLIFEESSAERLIKEWLIPWFAPNLRRLRTLAASGVTRVEPIMKDFQEMFLFAHLEPAYRGRAWIAVDGDEPGRKVVEGLRRDFSTWPAENFHYWGEGAFEKYYPANFQDRVGKALAIGSKQAKRKAKDELLQDVLVWIREDVARAKLEFESSAADVIAWLQTTEKSLDELSVLATPATA